jgi:hypothetical protein
MVRIDDLLGRLRQCAASLPEVKLAILFGSTARGKAGPKSDVDPLQGKGDGGLVGLGSLFANVHRSRCPAIEREGES